MGDFLQGGVRAGGALPLRHDRVPERRHLRLVAGENLVLLGHVPLELAGDVLGLPQGRLGVLQLLQGLGVPRGHLRVVLCQLGLQLLDVQPFPLEVGLRFAHLLVVRDLPGVPRALQLPLELLDAHLGLAQHHLQHARLLPGGGLALLPLGERLGHEPRLEAVAQDGGLERGTLRGLPPLQLPVHEQLHPQILQGPRPPDHRRPQPLLRLALLQLGPPTRRRVLRRPVAEDLLPRGEVLQLGPEELLPVREVLVVGLQRRPRGPGLLRLPGGLRQLAPLRVQLRLQALDDLLVLLALLLPRPDLLRVLVAGRLVRARLLDPLGQLGLEVLRQLLGALLGRRLHLLHRLLGVGVDILGGGDGLLQLPLVRGLLGLQVADVLLDLVQLPGVRLLAPRGVGLALRVVFLQLREPLAALPQLLLEGQGLHARTLQVPALGFERDLHRPGDVERVVPQDDGVAAVALAQLPRVHDVPEALQHLREELHDLLLAPLADLDLLRQRPERLGLPRVPRLQALERLDQLVLLVLHPRPTRLEVLHDGDGGFQLPLELDRLALAPLLARRVLLLGLLQEPLRPQVLLLQGLAPLVEGLVLNLRRLQGLRGVGGVLEGQILGEARLPQLLGHVLHPLLGVAQLQGQAPVLLRRPLRVADQGLVRLCDGGRDVRELLDPERLGLRFGREVLQLGLEPRDAPLRHRQLLRQAAGLPRRPVAGGGGGLRLAHPGGEGRLPGLDLPREPGHPVFQLPRVRLDARVQVLHGLQLGPQVALHLVTVVDGPHRGAVQVLDALEARRQRFDLGRLVVQLGLQLGLPLLAVQLRAPELRDHGAELLLVGPEGPDVGPGPVRVAPRGVPLLLEGLPGRVQLPVLPRLRPPVRFARGPGLLQLLDPALQAPVLVLELPGLGLLDLPHHLLVPRRQAGLHQLQLALQGRHLGARRPEPALGRAAVGLRGLAPPPLLPAGPLQVGRGGLQLPLLGREPLLQLLQLLGRGRLPRPGLLLGGLQLRRGGLGERRSLRPLSLLPGEPLGLGLAEPGLQRPAAGRLLGVPRLQGLDLPAGGRQRRVLVLQLAVPGRHAGREVRRRGPLPLLPGPRLGEVRPRGRHLPPDLLERLLRLLLREAE